jgi:hypothetical protein
MGMLETQIKRIPEGKTKSEYIQKLLRDLEVYFSDSYVSCESYEVKTLTESNFDEVWEVQDTYKDTPEIKAKYKNLAKEGQLIYIEIDY